MHEVAVEECDFAGFGWEFDPLAGIEDLFARRRVDVCEVDLVVLGEVDV